MSPYENIRISGSDTGAPRNLSKRIKLILEAFDVRNKTILDCGCGTGQYVLRLLDYTPHAYGIEYVKEKVEAFRAHNKYPENVRQGDIQHLDFEDKTFDMVLLNEVLEHVPDDRQALEQVHRILKDDGVLIVFSPNRLYPFETHGTQWKHSQRTIPFFVPFVPYIPLKLGSQFLHYNVRNYFPWDLKALMVQSGYRIVKQDFVWQTFENITQQTPRLLFPLSPILRALASTLEKIPLLRCFGISQMIVAQKKSPKQPPKHDPNRLEKNR
jgi:SAM-dependent methyltransferase